MCSQQIFETRFFQIFTKYSKLDNRPFVGTIINKQSSTKFGSAVSLRAKLKKLIDRYNMGVFLYYMRIKKNRCVKNRLIEKIKGERRAHLTAIIVGQQVEKSGVDSAIAPRGGISVLLWLEERKVKTLHVALPARIATQLCDRRRLEEATRARIP